jgi:hypothetical protein
VTYTKRNVRRASQGSEGPARSPTFTRTPCPGQAKVGPRLLWLAVALILLLTACAGATSTPGPVASPAEPQVFDINSGEAPLDDQHLFDIAWQALEPNTSSHDRANWEEGEVRRVAGRDVADEFDVADDTDGARPGYGCPGPAPPPNGKIEPSGTYWYAQLKRRPATPPPDVPTLSPTAPPLVPEPFIYQAFFLIDRSGQVVARKLYCVIY